MGIVKILIAMALVGVIIAVIVRLLPETKTPDKSEKCERCGGTGRIDEVRGKVPCPQCKGTGRAKW